MFYGDIISLEYARTYVVGQIGRQLSIRFHLCIARFYFMYIGLLELCSFR